MKKRSIVFGTPAVEEEDIQEVVDSLRSGWLGTGPKVARFEAEFAKYKSLAKTRAAAVNSCTAALHLSIITAGIGPGDEVITSALTFCATLNAIIHAGATPVLADVNPKTMNICPEEIEGKITSKTRAIIPVHFAGRCCDMDPIMYIAEKHDLKVIEDCAHAIESEYNGKKAGTFGDFACFSFYVSKNIMTGEGGMVLTKNDHDTAKIKTLSLHGMSRDAWDRFKEGEYMHYKVVECGFKYNMTDLQAALGIHQLGRVENNWLRRQQIWNYYQKECSSLPVSNPLEPELNTRHAYHLYTLLIDEKKTGINRDTFINEMTEKGIGVGVHYLSIPEHPYYRETFEWKPEDYPNAMRIGRQTVSIPLSVNLSDTDVKDVIAAVKNSIK